MDPAYKKWLGNLIEHISNNYVFNHPEKTQLLSHNISDRVFLYNLLHSTGLAFGYPASSVFTEHPLSKEWDEIDKAKIFFTESILACYIHYHKSDISIFPTAESLSIILTKAVESIAAFYSQYKPTKERHYLIELPKIFRSDSSTISKVEQTINHRLKPIQNLNSSYWHGSLYNVYIFLDLIFYIEWLIDEESILFNQESIIQHEIIKVIAVSIANSTDTDKHVEREFFKFFLQNAIEKEKLEGLGKIDKGSLSISSISIGKGWPGTINQILFEYGIFTLILDKSIDKRENTYINQLAEHLHIDFHQKEICILAVSSFIFKNLNKLSYLKKKYSLDIVSSNLSRRLRSIIIKNKGKIGREISESRELAELLWKAKNKNLTNEEREKVRQQLTDIFLRIIPSLAIVMVPGGSILLPLLLKIIPEEILLPSSFRNK